MGFIDTAGKHRFDPGKLAKNNLVETEHLFADLYCLEPGQSQKVHVHADATKIYYVVDGAGSFTLGDEVRELGPGSLAAAVPGEPHGVENLSRHRLVLLVVMAPNPNVSRSGGPP